ncbi:hypothetical protein ACLQ2R_06560 [Streptosporangium sp. DT93]|uniref:hypothetical protein n=1 Tax=Streptosporangium sp. DT93 TaxID=3393428 RepID=UPI003CE79469
MDVDLSTDLDAFLPLVAPLPIEYLTRNRGGATWLVAVSGAQGASSVILTTRLPVITTGGFSGGDPAMTVDRLRDLLSSGALGYVMTGGGRGGPDGGGSQVTEWVRANCAAIPAAEYGSTTGRPLYRCG